LDKNKTDDKIMCAELYRNVGNFTECKNKLETIRDEKYNWVKELLMGECERKNTKVIMLVRDGGDDDVKIVLFRR